MAKKEAPSQRESLLASGQVEVSILAPGHEGLVRLHPRQNSRDRDGVLVFGWLQPTDATASIQVYDPEGADLTRSGAVIARALKPNDLHVTDVFTFDWGFVLKKLPPHKLITLLVTGRKSGLADGTATCRIGCYTALPRSDALVFSAPSIDMKFPTGTEPIPVGTDCTTGGLVTPSNAAMGAAVYIGTTLIQTGTAVNPMPMHWKFMFQNLDANTQYTLKVTATDTSTSESSEVSRQIITSL